MYECRGGQQAELLCRRALPAPLLALDWKSLSVRARAADDRLQQLDISVAMCAVQRTVHATAEDSQEPSKHAVEEASTPTFLCSMSKLCTIY